MIVSKYLEHSHDLRFNMQRDNRAKQNTNTPKSAHTHTHPKSRSTSLIFRSKSHPAASGTTAAIMSPKSGTISKVA